MTGRALLLAALLLAPPLGAQPRETMKVRVEKGDTLSDIAERMLGISQRWHAIAAANPQLADPHLIHEREMLELRVWPLPATVTTVTGLASVTGGAGTTPLGIGDEIRMGDRVKTSAGAQVFVRVGERHRITVEPSSEVVWHALLDWPPTREHDVRIEVVAGRLSSDVAPLPGSSTFLVTTPSATSSVRGTDFRARAEGPASLLEVRGGQVVQRSEGGRVEVGPGQGTKVLPGEAPMPPRALLPPPTPLAGVGVAIVGRGDGARVAWTKVAGAVAYVVQLAVDEAFQQLVTEATSDVEELVLKDVAPGRYFVRVASRDDVGLEGLPSAPRSVVFVAP